MQDDIASTVTHIQIQIQKGSSTASKGVMELLVRKHDQIMEGQFDGSKYSSKVITDKYK